jgi:hypothetical protein
MPKPTIKYCPNCAAPIAATAADDVCPSCGLTLDAAEDAARRKFRNRAIVFLLGVAGFLVVAARYPPLEVDGMMTFVAAIFLLLAIVGLWMYRPGAGHLESEILRRIYYGLAPVPWLLTGILLVNGALDHAPPENCTTSVIAKRAIPGPWAGRRLIVYSWRDGQRNERLSVTANEYAEFAPGDRITVHVKPGLIGIPWVESVYR